MTLTLDDQDVEEKQKAQDVDEVVVAELNPLDKAPKKNLTLSADRTRVRFVLESSLESCSHINSAGYFQCWLGQRTVHCRGAAW